MQLQGPKKPLHAWLHVMTGSSKANWCDSYEKHTANLRELTHGRSRKSAKHPETCEKHGGTRKTVQGVWKLLNKKQNVSREVICDQESTYKKECTHVKLFLRNKNLTRFNKKILQRIEKRNDYDSIKREYSRKSQKARRHWISPDILSYEISKKTGNRIFKKNSNLNN